MGHVGHLGKNHNFLSPLRSLKFWNFQSFLFILKLSYSKPFYNTLNYNSIANIEEYIKFYNQGDKTFKTVFGQILTLAKVMPRNNSKAMADVTILSQLLFMFLL